MAQIPDHLTADIWLRQVFTLAEARRGCVVRRQIRNVERDFEIA